jgi:hypothetical protein
MRVVIFGSRVVSPYKNADKEHQRLITLPEAFWMWENLNAYHKSYPIKTVLSGCAMGVDKITALWAETDNIPVEKYPYRSELGKAGGLVRNKEMAEKADVGICFWDGFSNGTKHMLEYMDKLGKTVTLWRLDYFNEPELSESVRQYIAQLAAEI